ncbi:MAG: hypothetical protein B7C24_15215 [Bacteroidetes bacterium 4572_77]|nr:MAG: hypothetical protein B7C24_15215 [Bacteroidetes bacterium 4572_77]
MRKKYIPLFFLLLWSLSSLAQQDSVAPKKLNLLKNMHMIANMQMGFRSDFYNDSYKSSNFKVEQFRLEIKGDVSKKVSYRFRHRYTSTFEPQPIDHIIKGVDLAYVKLKLNKKWTLTIGKQAADWGGIEFDLNPIDIYEYADFLEYADNFLTGVSVNMQASENHSFGFQVLNTRTSTFSDLYGNVPDIKEAKTPLAGVLNWRGTFFDGKLNTIWSYSAFTEAQGYFMNYIALGQQLNLGKLAIAYDFKISLEDIDRTGVVSATKNKVGNEKWQWNVDNTLYYSHWTRISYEVVPKWSLRLDAFVDIAKWKFDKLEGKNTDDFRTAYGFVPRVEYTPWEEVNLKFYLGYVGRFYYYSDFAKTSEYFTAKDYNTGRVIFGIISPLHIF